MKIWILFLCALIVGASAQSDESAGDWDDDWKEYDDEWFKTRLAQLGIYNDEQKEFAEDSVIDASVAIEREQDEIDKIVQEDIKKYQDVAEDEGKLNDYQFEDNRSEQSKDINNDAERNQKSHLESENDYEDKAEPIHDNSDGKEQYFKNYLVSENDYEDIAVPNRDVDNGNNEDVSQSESDNDYDDYALYVGDDLEENVPENEDLQIPEPKFSKDDDMIPLPSPESNEQIKRIMDETQAIIKKEEEKHNDFALDDEIVEENSNELNDIVKETNNILEENLKPNDFAEDETNKDNFDFSADKERVQEINDGDFIAKPEDNNDDTLDNAYEDLNKDLDKLFETLDKLSNSKSEEDDKVKPADVDYAVNYDESLHNISDYETIFDSNLSDLFEQHSKSKEDVNLVNIENKNENIEEKLIEDGNDEKKSSEQVLEEVPYINDALLSDDKNEEKPVKSVNVDELSDNQLVQLMKDFEVQHSDVFDVDALSDNHIVNELTLEYGETKVITSENYPAGYPTNRVVDWIVTAKGQGIELNVTDLAMNSALGDYLMVKPG
ncbi:protein PFC0760c-like [Leguminivora glycinivorella]|uniref:protein PFC0760c-like n=1 Tax=Leguminivora glycinivorella TaxID=1035111 RepID=UPI00200E8FD0|nr:protein PFC0760c-like [Leguminivora glycinivorella]